MASSVRCGACNRDRTHETLVGDDGHSVVACPNCGSTDLAYVALEPSSGSEVELATSPTVGEIHDACGYAYRSPGCDAAHDPTPPSPTYPVDGTEAPPRPNPPPAGKLRPQRTENCPRCHVPHQVYRYG
jgi:ribosomal protein S27E